MSANGSDEAERSLMLGSGRQLDLIPGVELDDAGLPGVAYASEEERGRFTGERLFLQNPRVYRAIVRLLGRFETYEVIAETLEVSKQTITGVALRERIPVETIRERVGRLGLEVANLSLERIYEILADPANRALFTPARLKDLAVVFGIGVSNSQLLLGGATARVETTAVTEPGHEDYLRALADAEARARIIRNVTPLPIGLQAENPTAKGAAALALDAAGSVIELAPSPVATPVATPVESPAK